MWTSSNRAARLEGRTLRLPLHRSFAKVPKRATVKRSACYIELPRKLWDRIILSMFICCLFIFLHALLGFGVGDLSVSNHTFRTPLFTSPLRSRNAVGPNENQRIFAGGVWVMVDWHGNYELLPDTTSKHGAAGEGSRSIALTARTSTDIPVTFHGNLHDPFPWEFEGGKDHGRYPAKQPRTASLRARKRRFGRCLPEEVCL